VRTIQVELTKWASKNKMPLKKQRVKKVKAKPQPKPITTREVQELMGVYKPTYRCSKGGAIRQK
jgi:hypothetical protein